VKFGVNALILILLICLGILSPVHAEVEYNVLKTYKLEDQPVDMVFSATRNEIYVLNQKGELLIYAANGHLTEKINVDKVYDRLQLVEGSDILFFFNGIENAPVVIAVFSEFQ